MRRRRARRILVVFALAWLIGRPASAADLKAAVKEYKLRLGEVGKLPENARRIDQEVKAITAAITALAATNDPRAVDLLIKPGLSVRARSAMAEMAVYDAINDGLKRLEGPARERLYQWVEKKAVKKPALLQILIPIAAQYKKDPRAREAIAATLQQKSLAATTLMAAARAFEKRRDRDGVSELLAVFDKAKAMDGAPFHTLRQALFALTGQTFLEKAEWDKFWDTREATTAYLPKNKRQSLTVSTKERKAPRLFGSEVASRQVVIILDVSHSMHIKDPANPYKKDPREEELAAAHKGPKPGDPGYKPGKCTECRRGGHDANLPGYRQRLFRARRALKELVEGFDDNTRFNLIQYSTAARAWKKRTIVKGSSSNKKSALSFIASLKPEGVTRTDLALVEAFSCKGADTIYLISDGSPTDDQGKDLAGAELVPLYDTVRRMNKTRGVILNTIGLEGASRVFMLSLASYGNGRFFQVD